MSSKRAKLTGAIPTARVAQWGQGREIRSVQRGTITLTGGGVLTNTATLPIAVVPENSLLIYLGQACNAESASDFQDNFARLVFTNATTITALRTTAADAAVSIVVSFAVIEFQPGVIKSIQRGTCTNSGGTGAITAVNPLKADVMYLGFSYGGPSSFTGVVTGTPRLTLTNATTVTATSGGNNFVAGFQVVEWWQ